ncbi:MAG: hypothetical protein AAFO29_02390 [Actinomycetota bacterium]
MDVTLTTELPADFDPSTSAWVRYEGGPGADRMIDYSIAVVEADAGTGRIDFLVRWEPDAYCHRHRHLGETMAAVLVGEQHVIEDGPFETITKVRSAGFVGPVPDGETHWERGGSDGLTMLFSTHAPDGRLFEMVDDAGEVLATATIADFLERQSDVVAATG